MKDKIITLATLTYEKAHLVKTLLENEGIDCFLEHINLIQGAVSSGVKVKISEIDFEQAMIVFDSIREMDFESTHKEFELDKNINILVPVDFSEYSKKAVEMAFDWVSRLKGRLTIFNSFYSPVSSGLPFSDSYVYDVNLDELSHDLKEESESRIKEIEDELKNRLKEKNIEGVVVDSVIRRGIAEHEILGYSKVHEPSVIVMGTRGADKKAVDLIGSVTAEIIELAKCPVLAVPESFSYSGIDNIKTIGYLSIFSDADFTALEKLKQIVDPLGVKIVCCHISTNGDLEKDTVKMEGLRDHCRKRKIDDNIEFEIISNEDFLVGIESLVQSKNIDILSFTTYKRNLITRLLNASVAKKMLFHSTTPLLVFHA
ncbi:universal stress protein [Plebeiibacterium marinum]|uniref:Universal stress protein n=1 Tax=Plebeiibacterium marinum TaxID=2992111 RepID=A0AAE3MBP5_9BACT|nr:universal stress protein [Plebeiobacterium marinum]MCW3804836.1 universal stress protein [Plebeiobacterium marinum]